MKTCPNCNASIEDDAVICSNCGSAQGHPRQEPSRPANTAPALQLPTQRSLVKMIFLSLITLGIYGAVINSRISSEINIVASRYDGKRTIPIFAAVWLMYITCGVYMFIWHHQFSARVGAELERRGCDYSFGAKDFWLWNVLGALIIVGPYIYCHKLMKSMNMINENYNIYG